MKELSIDETVIVAGGLQCGPGTMQTFVVTADDNNGHDDGAKCDPA